MPLAVAAEIKSIADEWLKEWMPKLTNNEAPLNPYRVLWDLQHTVDVANTIITHDAGSPRDQLSPFWRTTAPHTYIGWGKTTQLGYGLGLAMGAKLAMPDKLCINVWGDAAIGFTGMDFETAVRERIPIMSILLNNFSMAIELHIMKVSTEKYRSTDISGDYAAMARAFGGYGERVTKPEDIIPAIKRGIEQTKKGVPVLLEFITSKEVTISVPITRRRDGVTMTVILTPTAEHKVAGPRRPVDECGRRREGHRLDAEARRHVPRRALRALPAAAVKGGDVDVAAFWTKLGGPVIASEDGEVWALGAPADERNAALEGLEAPDFTLPDIDGTPRTLVPAARQEGLPRHLGQLVRLPL